jgi:raffinose/stachyose/melibiose transport system permease protein
MPVKELSVPVTEVGTKKKLKTKSSHLSLILFVLPAFIFYISFFSYRPLEQGYIALKIGMD